MAIIDIKINLKCVVIYKNIDNNFFRMKIG